jgi:hypothetical protein
VKAYAVLPFPTAPVIHPPTERLAPAVTVAGLAVKARPLAFTTRWHVWETEDVEELDQDKQVLRDLVESLLRLTRVDRSGARFPR